ncbi:biopolymer transporter ExbD [Pseudodonghicola sp. IC7]|uniref:Biopolymer transporter ExbD n=2 Tax=Pseudodonghicola flavimaris TaxID=3050036 RepID=A0ABT7F5D2_9RHOB|nr:biopolymer transporter ExbD [Pseudodonghicola flavimaris]
MSFADPPRKPPAESIVPMINVVFLLLIFFLMTAQIAPPEPIAVEPPEASSEQTAEAELTLYLGPDGTLAYRETEGEQAVLQALELARIDLCGDGGCEGTEVPPLILRADGKTPAAGIARLLPQLAAIGFSDVQLVTVPK